MSSHTSRPKKKLRICTDLPTHGERKEQQKAGRCIARERERERESRTLDQVATKA
jgi:hypothetical protein